MVGFDNLNDYYDPRAEGGAAGAAARRTRTSASCALDSPTAPRCERAFADFAPQRVVNLAAQAGVRYSLTNPHAYVDSNLVGFLNILEACRHSGVEHLVYASSSSVYGANTQAAVLGATTASTIRSACTRRPRRPTS